LTSRIAGDNIPGLDTRLIARRLVGMNAKLCLEMAAPLCAVILGTGIVNASSSDEEAVRKVVNGFLEAWNRHDMNAFGALFAPDADFVNVAGIHWKGRESIQLNHAFVHGAIPADSAGVACPKSAYGIFKTSNLTFRQVDVRFLRKDVAVAHIQTELRGDARAKDTRHTLLVMILTKENGRWLIAVAQNTEINRPPELDR
jgi:ketosteroid isomerase-like protein